MISYVLHDDINMNRGSTRQVKQRATEEDDEAIECEDAPTVVIDESLDDKDPASHHYPSHLGYRRSLENEEENAYQEYGNNSSGGIRIQQYPSGQNTNLNSQQNLANIQAALLSIRN
jgi:hypothetical protein